MRTNYNSRYKIHNQELSAKDVMQKKKEKLLNNVEENDDEYNNDLKKKGNQVVSVSNYSTYHSITKPKHNHTFSSEILSGHNVFKYVNENGKLCDKNRTLTVNKQCVTSSIQEEVFLNETYDEMTNYLDDDDAQLIEDMILNEVIENERSKVTFSLVFNDVQNIEDVDNDGSRNEIINTIYHVVNNSLTDAQISKSDIRIIDIKLGSVIVDVEIINRIIDIYNNDDNKYYSRQIMNAITETQIYPNVDVSNQTIIYNNENTNNPIASSFDISLNEDTSCNIDLSGTYGGTGTIKYQIQTLPSGELFKTDDNGLFVLLNDQSIDTLIDSVVFRYVPKDNYNGSDHFDYILVIPTENDLKSAIARVNITIHGVNDDPDTSYNISGQFKQGFTLTADVSVTDHDNPDGHGSSIDYQWQYSDYSDNSFSNISGETDASFLIEDSKRFVDKYIRLVYTATDNENTVTIHPTDASLVENVNHQCKVNSFEILNTNGDDVVISSTHAPAPVQGNTLDVSFSISDEDVSDNELTKLDFSFNYQWYRSDTSNVGDASSIIGATDSSYTLTYDDVNNYIYVRISYNDGFENESFDSSFTNQVVSSGINVTVNSFEIIDSSGTVDVVDTTSNHPTQGNTLDVSFSINDIDVSDNELTKYSTDVSFNYQWYRSDTSNVNAATLIANATDSSYTLTYDDVNNYIYVRISYTDNQSSETFDSSFTNKVYSHGDNPISFNPDSNYTSMVRYYVNESVDYNFASDTSLIIDFGDHDLSNINFRMLVKDSSNNWTSNYTDMSGYQDISFLLPGASYTSYTWEDLSQNLRITGIFNEDTLEDQSNNWLTYVNPYDDNHNYMEIRLEAYTDYSSSRIDVSAHFSYNFYILNAGDPRWRDHSTNNTDVNSANVDVSQGDDYERIFYVDVSNFSSLTISNESIGYQWPTWLDFSYQIYYSSRSIVKISGTPGQQDISNYEIKFYAQANLGTKVYINSWYINVNDVNDAPVFSFVLARDGYSLLSSSDISQGDTLDLSFTITDVDVSTNSFNQDNIDDFFSSDQYSYQWWRYDETDSSNTLINGASTVSYKLTRNDISKQIWAEIIYTDSQGRQTDISTNKYNSVQGVPIVHPIEIFKAGTPNITLTSSDHVSPSDISQGDTLDLSFTIYDIDVSTNTFNQDNIDDFFSTDQYSYQWWREKSGTSTSINDASNSSYMLVQDDVGYKIWIDISYVGKPIDMSSDMYGPVNNVNDAPNTSDLSFTVINENGVERNLDNTTVIYQRETIRVDWSGVSIDPDGMDYTTITYQWYREKDDISYAIYGATDASYTLVQDDVDYNIYLDISYTDNYSYNEHIYTQVNVSGNIIQNVQDSPSFEISLSGILMVGYSLTVTVNNPSDQDGISGWRYIWQTSSSSFENFYTVRQIDKNATDTSDSLLLENTPLFYRKYVKVKVSMTDDYDSVSLDRSAMDPNTVSPYLVNSSSNFFFSRNGRVVNSAIANCDVSASVMLTEYDILTTPETYSMGSGINTIVSSGSTTTLTTSDDGNIDLAFDMFYEADVSYNDFLILLEIKNGQVNVPIRQSENNTDTSCVNNNVIYKVLRVTNGEIIDNTSSNISSYSEITSACNSIVYDLSMRAFWTYFNTQSDASNYWNDMSLDEVILYENQYKDGDTLLLHEAMSYTSDVEHEFLFYTNNYLIDNMGNWPVYTRSPDSGIPINNPIHSQSDGIIFDGTNHVELEKIELGGPMTIAFWARWDEISEWSRVLDFTDFTTSPSRSVFDTIRMGTGSQHSITNNDPNLDFTILVNETDWGVGGGTIVKGEWTHVVGTVNGTTITLYQNGHQVNSRNDAQEPKKIRRAHHHLGNSAFAGQYFQGAIYSLRIWDHALDASDVLSEYKGDSRKSIRKNQFRNLFGNASLDFIHSKCADFVMREIQTRKDRVLTALDISDDEIDVNPYDIIKIEAFHIISTAICKVFLSRPPSTTISTNNHDQYFKNLRRIINNNLIDHLPPEAEGGFQNYQNKDVITSYIEDVVNNITHPLDDDSDISFNEYRTNSVGILKAIGREVVDDNADVFFDDNNYATPIFKTRSLMSSINLKMNDNSHNIVLEDLSNKLNDVRGFIIPTDNPDTVSEIPRDDYNIYVYSSSNEIHVYPISNTDANTYDFLVWYLPIDISFNDKDDYPSITQYNIQIFFDDSYSEIKINTGDNYISLARLSIDSMNYSFLRDYHFLSNEGRVTTGSISFFKSPTIDLNIIHLEFPGQDIYLIDYYSHITTTSNYVSGRKITIFDMG